MRRFKRFEMKIEKGAENSMEDVIGKKKTIVLTVENLISTRDKLYFKERCLGWRVYLLLNIYIYILNHLVS